MTAVASSDTTSSGKKLKSLPLSGTSKDGNLSSMCWTPSSTIGGLHRDRPLALKAVSPLCPTVGYASQGLSSWSGTGSDCHLLSTIAACSCQYLAAGDLPWSSLGVNGSKSASSELLEPGVAKAGTASSDGIGFWSYSTRLGSNWTFVHGYKACWTRMSDTMDQPQQQLTLTTEAASGKIVPQLSHMLVVSRGAVADSSCSPGVS